MELQGLPACFNLPNFIDSHIHVLVIIIIIIIIIMPVQPFVGPWPLFQFLDSKHSR
jgi:hypothetical protein